jgi:hypothetical protein
MSSIELVRRYLAERTRPTVLVPLSALLAFTAWAIAPPMSWSTTSFVASTGTAFLLVLAFRVWDDLEDRGRDARLHPDRLMVADGRTTPFVVLALALAMAGIAIIAAGDHAPRSVGIVLCAAVILVAWYRLRDDDGNTVLAGHVVLLKYPALAVALAPSIPTSGIHLWRAAAIVAAVYLAICVYESLDDPALRTSRAARRVAIVELVLIVPLVVGAFTFSGVGAR